MKIFPVSALFTLACALSGYAGAVASAQPAAPSPPPAAAAARATLTDKVKDLQTMPGFFPLHWDEKAGKLWLEIPRLDDDFLYVASLPAGLGSNDIGLDRGQLSSERLVRFVRSGPRVLLVQRNLAFRAELGSAAERRAVEDSFAQSVLAGFEVAAEEDGRVLVDATEFYLRDAHDVIGSLRQTRQGTFALDAKRSAFHLPRTKAFPRNTEVEVMLTFAGNEPGEYVRDVAPDPRSLTVRERHSFIRLPDPGYEPRLFDPRAGYFGTSFADYSTPIGEPITRRFINRHRLVKKDPTAERSEPVTPIIYYLDPATPEPIRSALLDGARWWAQAFEAAGFINAYRVEMLPEDADPMDVRYNVIQWVHRATRGWSYGASIADPRTGEIIKGHVSLGSLRVRQDYLIAEGLLAPYEDGRPASPAMERMALARLRQLSAHEVGHTLGIAHNFYASTADRSSVMDYPHPLALLQGAVPSLDQAYTGEIGAWDKVAVDYGYRQFAPGADAAAGLEKILIDARSRGLGYLTDQDARPLGSAHPATHLWDNGSNAVDEFQRVLTVRAAALARFGENAIPRGRPLATLEETLVPLYLAHRYQLEAASKVIAGTTYTYALRGDGQVPLIPVPAAEQRRAVAAVLAAVKPDTLALPPSLLSLIPPRPPGYGRHRELFASRTGLTFDALAPAETAAGLTFDLLLNADRAGRLVQQHALNAEAPGLEELLTAVLDATWRTQAGADYAGEVQRVVSTVALSRLFTLAATPRAAPQVKAVVMAELEALQAAVQTAAGQASSAAQRAHLLQGARQIADFFANPREYTPPPVSPAPPGQPIGTTLACELD